MKLLHPLSLTHPMHDRVQFQGKTMYKKPLQLYLLHVFKSRVFSNNVEFYLFIL
jgi:hypothetical protein